MHDARRDVIRRGYDEIAHRYVASRTAGGDVGLLAELVARLNPGDAVLDAGCGAGVPVTRSVTAAGMAVTSVDLSGMQLELARSRVPEVYLAQADLVTLPFAGESKTNLEMLQNAHFDVLRNEIVTDPMDHGHHLFVLVAAC